MKQMITELVIFILFIGSIGYILGAAGLSDNNKITLKECSIRLGIGIVILAIDVALYLLMERRKR